MFLAAFGEHLGRFWLAYLIFFLIFAIGLFCGYLAPSFLDSSQIGDLHNYLDQSLKALPNADLQIAKESKNAFFFNGGILFFLFLSGMTVFGLFLLVPALFYKGFTMGFSIGLMFGHKVAEGMVITVLTILPQALLIVPLIMAGALYSSLFSLSLSGIYNGQDGGFGSMFMNYLLIFILLMFLMALFCLAQGFFGLFLLKIFFAIL